MITKEKSQSQIMLEKEVAIFKENVERVRLLLVSHNAEDLIPMLLSDLENYYPIIELSQSPNGSRTNRKKR